LRSFDADIITALAAVEARAFWLVECHFDTTYYFTDCDIDLVYQGNVYQSDQGLKVSNIIQGSGFSVDKATLEFGNVGLWMSAIILNEDVANDRVIVKYIMYSVEFPVIAGGEIPAGVQIITGDVTPLDGDVTLLGGGGGEFYSLAGEPPTLFDGFLTDWKLKEKTATFSLSTEFMLWRKKALRLPTPSCPWSFQGDECGYSGGEDWCDQSVERCKLLSNYDSFGGRRYIAAIEDKKLWWGVKGFTGGVG
jgi:hypothetical protein